MWLLAPDLLLYLCYWLLLEEFMASCSGYIHQFGTLLFLYSSYYFVLSRILYKLSIRFSWSLSLSKTSKHESTNSFSSYISLFKSSISSLLLKWYLVKLLTKDNSFFLFFGTGDIGLSMMKYSPVCIAIYVSF